MIHIFGSAVKKKTVIFLAIAYIVVLAIIIFTGNLKKMKQKAIETNASSTIDTTQNTAQSDVVDPSSGTLSSDADTTVDTKQVLQTLASATEAENDGLLTLVNMSHLVPSDWTVDLVELRNGQSIDRRAYDGLQSMMDDARNEGLDPLICSSYRTQDKQEELYNNKVSSYKEQGYAEDDARAMAAVWVAYPGTSEHQLGLTVDICSISNQNLDSSQETTETQQWLMTNCYKYGFILRYPSDKADITGISYEPWHYRYVGIDAATAIYEQGLCLEEYLELNQ